MLRNIVIFFTILEIILNLILRLHCFFTTTTTTTTTTNNNNDDNDDTNFFYFVAFVLRNKIILKMYILTKRSSLKMLIDAWCIF